MKTWFSGFSVTPRQTVLPLALLLFVVLYLWLPGIGSDAHTRLQNEVLALRTQAAALEQQAAEVERLAALPPAAVSADTLLVQVRAAAVRTGFDESVLRVEASGPDQVAVSAAVLDFTAWLLWVEELQALNIRMESARIGATATPGMVSVTASLLRPVQP